MPICAHRSPPMVSRRSGPGTAAAIASTSCSPSSTALPLPRRQELRMKIAFYGSSLLSSYWNGAATYYRGILHELAKRGYRINFYEPDAFDRQQHRDMDPPDWVRSVVYPATADGLRSVLAEAAAADIVVKAS